MEKNTQKINFFKKIYFSIFKIKKYKELVNDGFWKSIKYVIDVLMIFSILYAIIISWQTKLSMNKLKAYLENNLPDFVCENNMLTTEVEERKILDDKLVKINFGGQIIIDTITEYEQLIDEYVEKAEPSIILTNDFFTTINASGQVDKLQYNDIIEKYLNKYVKRIDKEELLYLFDDFIYSQYFIAYMFSYLIAHSILVFIYALVLTAFYFISFKIKKIKIKFVYIYATILYSMTLTMFGFFILNFIPTTFKILTILRTILIIIPIIYVWETFFSQGFMQKNKKYKKK